MQQHVIPRCYQKSWLAPECPADSKFEPYVWLLSKDGTSKKRKAPKNVFVENEKYTIHLTDGSRDLVVEDTLMQTESAFMAVLPKITAGQSLSISDRAQLCIFMAAMHARANEAGRRFAKFFGDVHRLVVKGEREHNAPPVTSLETKDLAQHAHQRMVQATLDVVPQMLFRMSLAVLVTDERLGFITSDTPCNWNDPDSHRKPPAMRGSSLSCRRIEITLPLTPRHTLMFTHNPKLNGYFRIAPPAVDELNRIQRFRCLDQFISLTGETKSIWFEERSLPADAWEITPDGREAMAEHQRRIEMMQAWQRERPWR